MAYGGAEVTKKSAFKGSIGGGVPTSKPNDGFARVTWTDLAMGKGGFGKNNDDSREHSSRQGSRPMIISPEVANFSLANQNVNGIDDYEEIKSEVIESDEDPDEE